VRLLSGYRVYQMVVTACRLQLPDLVAAGPREAADMATETGVHAPSLHRLMRALAAWEFFVEEPDGRFASTRISDTFRSDKPGLRNMTLMLADDGYLAWASLSDAVRTGRSAYEHHYGKNHFDFLADDPEASARFNAAMVESTVRVAGSFVEACDFTGVHTVVDVAGGSGALLAAVLRAHPQMRGILFDIAQGLSEAPENLETLGVADRVTIAEGSFFESVPSGADLYMLKSIIHDWPDVQALEILRACRVAMRPAARLVLVERILPERIDSSQASLETAMGDMQMMVVTGGKERTAAQFADLLSQADLRMTRVIPTASWPSIIEAVPAK
jgi:precorrin-6B methylase 2